MKRRNILLAGGFLLVILAVALLPGFFGGNEKTKFAAPPGHSRNNTEQERTVRSETVQRRTVQEYLTLNGNIDFSATIDIYPDTGGNLQRYTVAVGEYIQKGSLVAHVDPSRPGEHFELSPVYAPTDGVIIKLPYSEGTTVSTTTSLMQIAKTDELEIQARVIERDIGLLREGLHARVVLEAWPDEVFHATVSRVTPFLDSASRSKEITLVFDKTDSRINAGMFVRLQLDTRIHENALTVSELAVQEQDDEYFVWTIDGDNRARKRIVNQDVSVDGRTIIISGLEEGARVINEGIQSLSEGIPVRDITAQAGEGTQQ